MRYEREFSKSSKVNIGIKFAVDWQKTKKSQFS
jgi:hypothetical protein